MDFKGTIGEWFAEFGYENETTIKCGEIRIAEVKHYNDGSGDWSANDPFKEEGQFNAKLIVCAQEILEQLKKSNEILSDFYDTLDFKGRSEIRSFIDKSSELIKKATE